MDQAVNETQSPVDASQGEFDRQLTERPKRGGVTEATFNKKGFWALIAAQVQGAFNDNLYQYLLIIFLIGFYEPLVAAGQGVHFGFGWLSIDVSRNVENIASLLFSLPFIIFPAIFGALSDRFSKQSIAIATKYIELVTMAVAGIAFYFHSIPVLWFVLFMLATHSAFFAPSKYGILPEILPEPRLSWANGIVQMSTIVAIILGVGVSGPLYKFVTVNLDGHVYYTSFVLIGFTLMGLIAAHFITRPPAANPSAAIPMNPFLPWKGMGKYFRAIANDKVLTNVVIGYIYFWFAGVFMRNTIVSYWSRTLGFPEDSATFLIAAMSVGIAGGALTAGFLSRRKIELGLVPIGVVGLIVCCGLMAVPASFYLNILGAPDSVISLMQSGQPLGEAAESIPTSFYVFLILAVVGLGAFGGVFDVPLAASLQQRAPHSMKGGVIATINMMTFVGMAMASIVLMLLQKIGFSAYGVFGVLAIVSAAVGLFINRHIPHLMLRAVLWILTNTIYRVFTLGRTNIPEQGGALFVGNHLSMVDALAIYTSTDRQVRFLVGDDIQNTRWMRRVAKTTGMILFNPQDPQNVLRAMEEARLALAEGYVVCISTDLPRQADGSLLPFVEAPGLLVEGSPHPIVPVHIDRTWGRLYEFRDQATIELETGKVLSDEKAKLVIKRPWRIPYPIQVNYGPPLAQACTLGDANLAIQQLGVEAYYQRKPVYTLLHRGFMRAAKRHLRRRGIVDQVSGELTYMKLLAGSIVFARKLKTILDDKEMVGVLLPPSVGGVLTNIALSMLGRVPVNLNYTASAEALQSCAQQCGFTQVLTSRKFLERLPSLKVPANTVFVDDIKETVTGKDRIIALFMGLLLPARMLEKSLGAPARGYDDLATIIFSSGSEGEPKGIMLTHRNVITNIEQTLETFPHNEETSVIGYLPFFHSFGFMATLWMPILRGIHALYHPNPLEPKVIGQLVQEHRGSIMIGTSTFLQNFIRRCTPEQLASLSFVVTGAEKLAPRVRIAFKEKFVIEPLEGYGTTECAPAVSVNVPDLVSPGFHAVFTRHGTIGRPLPGQAVRVVDPDSGELLPNGVAGLLQVKGPNIMKGYLHQPEKTAAVLHDGWYSTGDIAAISHDAFITITDRLARFSKIAGEMVPHIKVEEALHELLELNEQALAVASVPDSQKGERLVVLHTLSEEQLETLLGKLDQSALPNLWIPRASNFYRIEALPVMATGKMDIKAIKNMAKSLDVGGGS